MGERWNSYRLLSEPMHDIPETLLRRVWHLRPSERRRTDLLRPLRPPASRTGKRRHRHLRRQAVSRAHRGMGLVSQIFNGDILSNLARHHGRRPHALLDHRLVAPSQRPTADGRLRARPDRHRAQRQSHQRRPASRANWKPSGSIFQTTVDSEIILHLMAQPSARTAHENNLIQTIRRIEGAYSLVIMTETGADRRARSARVSPALHRQAGRRLGAGQRNLRVGPDSRQVRARR